MKVLMSIKTEYTDKIFKGIKNFELRKKSFNNKVETIIVYSSGKTKKVIGELKIECVIKDSPENIWNLYKDYLGISEKNYFEYYKNHNIAYAIKIKSYRKYDEEKELSDYGIEKAPQSFYYIKS